MSGWWVAWPQSWKCQKKIEELEIDAKGYLDDLEVALVLLSNAATLYDRLGEKEKNELLQIITNRIIINEEGEIISHVLKSPFAYLSSLAARVSRVSKEESGSEQIPGGAHENAQGQLERFFFSFCELMAYSPKQKATRYAGGNSSL